MELPLKRGGIEGQERCGRKGDSPEQGCSDIKSRCNRLGCNDFFMDMRQARYFLCCCLWTVAVLFLRVIRMLPDLYLLDVEFPFCAGCEHQAFLKQGMVFEIDDEVGIEVFTVYAYFKMKVVGGGASGLP